MREPPLRRERPEARGSPTGWGDSIIGTPLTLAQIQAFDDVIDARSPAEYAEDHLPAAINSPVLDDEERALVGTVYKQRSAFEAKRMGAPLAARNIARAIEERFARKARDWRPLVYCWRGGGRSGALVHVLRQVGWNALRLEGGYKAFRKQVVADLDALAPRLRFNVVCGATGSGKSRLLEALAEAGAQVLDLEVLAAHRGSVLGDLPDEPQPSQKAFETAIWTAISGFDARVPVYVESESKKVGNLRVPEALIAHMREGRCFRVEAGNDARVALLMDDYAHLIADPARLVEKLECLKDLHGAERIDQWKSLIARREWQHLVLDLLESHYDPAYRRSMFRNYRGAQSADTVVIDDASHAGFRRAAERVLSQAD